MPTTHSHLREPTALTSDRSDTGRRAAPRKTFTPCHLAAWRVYVHATQQELADFIGYSKSHVSSIETGVRPWSQEFLEAAAEFFQSRGVAGLSAGDIIDLDPSNPVQAEIWLLARRVPPEKREAAADMLCGLSRLRETPAPPAPRRRGRPTTLDQRTNPGPRSEQGVVWRPG